MSVSHKEFTCKYLPVDGLENISIRRTGQKTRYYDIRTFIGSDGKYYVRPIAITSNLESQAIICPFCGNIHIHGISSPGERVNHCHENGEMRSYIIRWKPLEETVYTYLAKITNWEKGYINFSEKDAETVHLIKEYILQISDGKYYSNVDSWINAYKHTPPTLQILNRLIYGHGTT